MFWFSIILVFANLLFLGLGVLLYNYANQVGIAIPERSDLLFPTIALNHLSPTIGIIFILGLIAAAYSSADSALTALTTSFCIDIIELDKKPLDEQKKLRKRIHVLFSVILVVVIILFDTIFTDVSVIWELFKAAGYTYGPLLGLFAFGILTKKHIRDNYVWIIAIVAPILSYLMNMYSETLFYGYKFGFEILIVNGLLTFLGLFLISKKRAVSID